MFDPTTTASLPCDLLEILVGEVHSGLGVRKLRQQTLGVKRRGNCDLRLILLIAR